MVHVFFGKRDQHGCGFRWRPSPAARSSPHSTVPPVEAAGPPLGIVDAVGLHLHAVGLQGERPILVGTSLLSDNERQICGWSAEKLADGARQMHFPATKPILGCLPVMILAIQKALRRRTMRKPMPNPFQNRQPYIGSNADIRTPQREAYQALVDFASNPERLNVKWASSLPVGCGKSGCITLAPFAFRANRVLVVAPGVSIAEQLAADFNPSNGEMFYQKCCVITGPPYPEPVEIRGTTTNRTDLEEAHVVITNIQQLQGNANRWLQVLPTDFFDVILFDEGHHSVAESWETLKARFPVVFELLTSAPLHYGRMARSWPPNPLLLPHLPRDSRRLCQASEGGPAKPPDTPLRSPRGRSGDRSRT